MSTIKDETIERFTREDPVPIEMNIDMDMDADADDEDNRVYLWLCWGLVGIIALSYMFV